MILNLSGIGVTSANGRIKGTVIQRGRGFFVGKNQGNPQGNNSALQTIAKSNLLSLSKLWKTIGAVNQQGWDNLATTVHWYNVSGAQIHLSGHAVFVKCNSYLRFINKPITQVPPDPYSNWLPTEISLINTAGDLALTTSLFGVPTNETWHLKCTPGISTGLKPSMKGGKYIEIIPAMALFPHSFTLSYAAVFGNYQVGALICAHVRRTNSTTGFAIESNITSIIPTV